MGPDVAIYTSHIVAESKVRDCASLDCTNAWCSSPDAMLSVRHLAIVAMRTIPRLLFRSNDAFDADTSVDVTKAESVVNLLGGAKQAVLLASVAGAMHNDAHAIH